MQDGDGDGFGDLNIDQSLIDAGVAVGTDCNDSYSGGAYPDALTLELCNLYSSDTTDYDCDSSEESGASRCSMDMTGTFSLSGTVSEYWSNGSAKPIGDISGDGVPDFVVSAHAVGANSGKLYSYEGPLTSSSVAFMSHYRGFRWSIAWISRHQCWRYQW